MHFLGRIISLFCFVFLAFTEVGMAQNCQKSLQIPEHRAFQEFLTSSPMLKKFPKKYFFETLVPQDGAAPISFGYEGELNVREHPNLVRYYRPIDLDATSWHEWTYEQRVLAAQRFEKENHLLGKNVKAYKLEPDDSAENVSFIELLPQVLNFEGNGNVEINGAVRFTLFEVYQDLKNLSAAFSPLYFQAHVVWPKMARKGIAGYTIFTSDLAQLEVLESGWKTRKTREPGKNLLHSSLGPISADDVSRYKRMQTKMNAGEKMGSGDSSRVVYATVPRDDVYPEGFVGYELRRHNKRWQNLFEEASLLTLLIQTNKIESFELFESIPPLSEDTLSEYISRTSQQGLWTQKQRDTFYLMTQEILKQNRTLAWGGAHPSIRYFWPLRNWTAHPIFRTLPDHEKQAVLARVESATRKYFKALIGLGKNGYHEKASLLLWRHALANWSRETSLAQYFQHYEETKVQEALKVYSSQDH